jgi:hypothetical protein
MASKTQDKAIDTKALVATIAKGWKLVDTPKVRAGFKKGQQQLVQADGKTLGMLTLREKGVRLEGSRLDKNMTVTNATGAAQARKLLAAVEAENKAKASKPKADARTSATRAAARMSAVAGSDPRGDAPQPSGRRARSRTTRHQVIA